MDPRLDRCGGRGERARALRVKLFADGADVADIQALRGPARDPGVHDQPDADAQGRACATTGSSRTRCWRSSGRKPISFEVFADDFAEMERQAREIATWGPSVYVKIPVTDTRGRADRRPRSVGCRTTGVRVNVTAVLTLEQVARVGRRRWPAARRRSCRCSPGRIADTGRDPVPIVAESVKRLAVDAPAAEVIWASPRELLNIFQADAVGCHIITLTGRHPEEMADGRPGSRRPCRSTLFACSATTRCKAGFHCRPRSRLHD